jgi:hypothetical protein
MRYGIVGDRLPADTLIWPQGARIQARGRDLNCDANERAWVGILHVASRSSGAQCAEFAGGGRAAVALGVPLGAVARGGGLRLRAGRLQRVRPPDGL